MKHIIAFAGSNSRTSINKQLAIYVASLVEGVEVIVLDLNNFELPIYGIDYENTYGIPENAKQFLEQIKNADGIVLSLAEHNGAYTSVFKNLFDWMSVIDGKLWSNKPMLLMATSPGERGGRFVLEIAKARFVYMGGNIVSEFSLPSFDENFANNTITSLELKNTLKEAINTFENALK